MDRKIKKQTQDPFRLPRTFPQNVQKETIRSDIVRYKISFPGETCGDCGNLQQPVDRALLGSRALSLGITFVFSECQLGIVCLRRNLYFYSCFLSR